MTALRLTVCQLHNDPAQFEHDWRGLVSHVHAEKPNLILLPEMPFGPWFVATREYSVETWNEMVHLHEQWLKRLPELGSAAVMSSRPINEGENRYNEGFIWDAENGYRAAHRKAYLPDEEGFWEASWYQRGPRTYTSLEAHGARIGFLICTEMWFNEHARAYGRQGAHLIVTSRMTEPATLGKWMTGGRAVAVVSGAYHASSTRYGTLQAGGVGWVIAPDGDVVALTSDATLYRTVSIDLDLAERSKQTYPRYVDE
ncbi:MAG: carbon-nitrogen hydrolase family protein [Chloroflexi bacterium]|nr:carbon-nitrogen hydrolase family protein [Chloroflexota bacterium]